MPDLMTLVFGEADDFVDTLPRDDDEWGPSDEDGPPIMPSPPADGDWVCEQCGRAVPKRRGRKPKVVLCDDHRSTTGATAPKGSSSTKRLASDSKDEHRLKKISGDLQQALGELTGTIVPFMPVTGTTIALQGPPACDAVVQIAAPWPRFLDGLEKAALALPWITVAKFIIAVMVATQVDMNRITPYGIAPELLGVTKAAEKAGWRDHREPAPQRKPADQPAPDRSSVHGFTAPLPPRFKL